MVAAILKTTCKSALNKSSILDYTVNPYIGCEHACKYCYSYYLTKKVYPHYEFEWGSVVFVKENLLDVLRSEVARKRRGCVFLSSLTDPYQPAERNYQLTRNVLKILLNNSFKVWIQTKSSLVLRDMDILERFTRSCEVCITLTTLNDAERLLLEPFSSPVEERVEALRKLSESGIKTSIFFGPIIPLISERHLGGIVELAGELKVSCLFFDKLNLKPFVVERLLPALRENFPKEVSEKVERIILSKELYRRYYASLKRRLVKTTATLAAKGVKAIFCY